MPLDGSVVAKQRNRSATGPAVIQVLRPLRIQRSPRRSARVRMAKMSEPASGSLAPLAPSRLPSHRPGRYRRFWASVPKDDDRHRDRPQGGIEREDQPRVGTAVAQALHGRDGRRQVLAPAAVLLGHGQARDAEPGASGVPLAPEPGVSAALRARARPAPRARTGPSASCQCCCESEKAKSIVLVLCHWSFVIGGATAPRARVRLP